MKNVEILMMNNYSASPTPSEYYGAFYNGYAAIEPNLAPIGWTVPSDNEFRVLRTALGWNSGAKLKVTGTTYWISPNASATNQFGWNAKGVGIRRFHHTEIKQQIRYYSRDLYYVGAGTYVKTAVLWDWSDDLGINGSEVGYGYLIRLLYTGATTPPPPTLTDIDGNIYGVINIGDQYWISSDWKCSRYNDGSPITNLVSTADWGIADNAHEAGVGFFTNPF